FQLGGQAHGPQEPQGILLEPFDGMAHGADNARREVPLAAVGVHQPLGGRIVSQRVDGQISPLEVILDAPAKGDPARVAGVLVAPSLRKVVTCTASPSTSTVSVPNSMPVGTVREKSCW